MTVNSCAVGSGDYGRERRESRGFSSFTSMHAKIAER